MLMKMCIGFSNSIALRGITVGLLMLVCPFFGACAKGSIPLVKESLRNAKDPKLQPSLKAPSKKIRVSTASELKGALLEVQAGDTIALRAGIYAGKFVIPAGKNGKKDQPIILQGPAEAILDAGSISTGYVLHVQANYWIFQGFTVQNGLKGIVCDEASHNVFRDLKITGLGEEGIHFRKFSKHNLLQNSRITYTGLHRAGYGEAVYIGTAVSNWNRYTAGEADRCDSNQVINNHIGPYVSAEAIDIKEGTTGGLIEGNYFDGTGLSGENSADSWLDVKGNHYIIRNNIGLNHAPSALLDGFQVNCAVEGWGSYNVFDGNNLTVNATGYGISIRLKSSKGMAIGNIVYDNNIVVNGEKGTCNIGLTLK